MNICSRRFMVALFIIIFMVWSGMHHATAEESTLRIFMVGDARHLDPHLATDFATASNAYIMHLRLVSMDGTGQVHPMGAKSWKASADGLVYTFTLDPHAKFHNGKAVTAEDWQWSFNRLAQPETGSPVAHSILGGVIGFEEVRNGKASSLQGIRVIDPTTLEISLKPEGRGGFINRLTSYNASVLNQEEILAGDKSWFEKADAGAGPFTLVNWERNSKFVYAAHKDYSLGAPKIDKLEMLIVPSTTTRLNLYEAGQLDISDVPLADYQRIAADPTYKDQLKIFPRAQIIFLGLNPVVYEPFKDVRVRRAIAHAIDNERIAKTVFFGFFTPAQGIVPPQVPGVDPNIEGLPYDPETARKLLAEVGGVEKLPPLEMPMNPASDVYQTVAQAVAAMLKEELGLEVRLLKQEFAAYQAALNRRNVFASFVQGWSAGFLDYSYYLDLLLDSRSRLNRTNYNNPEFDKLIDQANSVPTEKEREALYRKAEQIAVKDATMVPIVFTRFAMLVKPYVHGFEGSPLSLGWTDLSTIEIRR